MRAANRRVAYGVAAALFAIGSSHAAAAAVAPTILHYQEHLGPRKISANEPVVGVVLGLPSAKIVDPVLYVQGLKSTDHTLCIEIERVDGSYGLDLTADVTGAVSQASVRLPFGPQSPNFKDLRGLPIIEVAVLARVSSVPGSCRNDTPFAPAAWRAGTLSPVNVLLLSRDATATLNVAAGSQHHCVGLSHVAPVTAGLTSFDTACTVEELPCATTSTVSIRREEDDGGRLPLIRADIRAACSR